MANANLQQDAANLFGAIKNQEIFHAQVSRLGMTEEDKPYMIVRIPAENGLKGGYSGIIYASEADAELERQTLVPMMGRVIPFVVTDIDMEKDRVVCSRKLAQEKLKAEMMPDFMAKKVYEGTIINIVNYGAYVEVNGVSGLLKTGDFSVDRSEIAGVHKIGDKINVIFKELTPGGRINWEAETKYHRPDPIEYDFEANTVVLGTVVNIQNFNSGTGVFVRIADGLDALCTVPQDREVEIGTQVSIKISVIDPPQVEGAPPRVRGKIVRVL